ncbi:DNA helicase PcrA [Alicyclobacillus mali]|uniref:ATP-dependent DNA helicase n=1 Tax=Alicyclobacillus mali (ex Roth et al. 2021) TaxID=1123961 RepID=A0ABS0F0E0_9BACL|nr:DNA helicase PcrA [Alicyclobacillus mali (ex Roth et al. 2021)]MBF8376755.1 DNA helicase PcrA [Alicyclobacillus mali (ex Roth et al. 2021)]MCL6488021.1 DNA helicase PcrA [Alicyclobacillus mali (ex Roth et al. 2021)]
MVATAGASDILKELNEKQREAVTATDGPVLVIAGAGSGKTSVLTRRIAYLIAERRVPPWAILAITFTNKAAREMEERIERLVGPAASDIWTSTFHAMCARILRRDIHHLGYTSAFTVLDAADQVSLVRRLMQEMNIDVRKFEPRAVLSAISQHKNELRSAEKALDLAGSPYDKMVGDVYLAYERRLRENQALDFDDLLVKTVELFRKVPDVLAYYQHRFSHIHVDEYQDTNHAQYVLVKLLAERRRNLCVVGDSDQSIYGWRGADIRNILEFQRDYPDARVIRLEQNYRSTGRILRIANQVIQHNQLRLEKNLWTDRGEGERAKLFIAPDERVEADWVADEIARAVSDGRQYRDVAILYRTNAQSRVLEEAFLHRGIPYRIYGGLRFYERREVKDVIAYLRLVANPNDDVSFLRVVNVPKRGIGDTTLEKLAEYARQRGTSLFEAALHASEAGVSKKAASALQSFVELIQTLQLQRAFLPLTDLTDELLDRSGYREALRAERSLEAENRLENLDEFLSLTREFDENGVPEGEMGALEQFLTHVALVSDADLPGGRPGRREDVDEVSMMTLHAAKGLEFPVVFLVGLEEGVFPHRRALDGGEELEEERRLCYVGITRAMERVYMTTCRSRMLFGERRSFTPSRFLSEMPTTDIERVGEEDTMFGRGWRDARAGMRAPAHAVADAASGPRMSVPRSFGADLSVPYEPGDLVEHRKWGRGVIVAKSGEGESLELVVRFDDPIGEKRLFAKFAPIQKVDP